MFEDRTLGMSNPQLYSFLLPAHGTRREAPSIQASVRCEP